MRRAARGPHPIPHKASLTTPWPSASLSPPARKRNPYSPYASVFARASHTLSFPALSLSPYPRCALHDHSRNGMPICQTPVPLQPAVKHTAKHVQRQATREPALSPCTSCTDQASGPAPCRQRRGSEAQARKLETFQTSDYAFCLRPEVHLKA